MKITVWQCPKCSWWEVGDVENQPTNPTCPTVVDDERVPLVPVEYVPVSGTTEEPKA